MNLNKTLKLINFEELQDSVGLLVVVNAGQIPFEMRRIFTVFGKKNTVRGRHAHKRCSQLLISTSGKIEIKVNNGSQEVIHTLQSPGIGLLIPPGIWAEQLYLTDGAILTVICDRPYEPEDYIRDFSEFLNFVNDSDPSESYLNK
jgi:dTDP-4-dehydrorhamnose 3,5-epimerase-like enzyme